MCVCVRFRLGLGRFRCKLAWSLVYSLHLSLSRLCAVVTAALSLSLLFVCGFYRHFRLICSDNPGSSRLGMAIPTQARCMQSLTLVPLKNLPPFAIMAKSLSICRHATTRRRQSNSKLRNIRSPLLIWQPLHSIPGAKKHLRAES